MTDCGLWWMGGLEVSSVRIYVNQREIFSRRCRRYSNGGVRGGEMGWENRCLFDSMIRDSQITDHGLRMKEVGKFGV